MRLDPYVNYRGTCEAAFRFYEQHLGGRIASIEHHSGADPRLPPDWKGKVLHARVDAAASARARVRLQRFAVLLLCVSCNAETPRTSPAPDSSQPDVARTDSLPPPPRTQTPDSLQIQPGPTLLTPDGWGPLRIGMSRAEVVAAAGADARPDAVGGPDPEACDEFRPRDAPVGILVMIEGDVLTRISLSRTSDISTPAGFRVGDAGADVHAGYGAQAVVQPHKYWEPPARYVTVWREADGERRGIRYEIDADDDVVHIHAGGPSIEYVEGCL